MRIKDIQAGVEYATCDGHLVVPVAPVHANYTFARDKEGKVSIVDAGPKTDYDPWANCHPGRGGGGKTIGVKVDVFTFDRDGKRLKKKDTTIVPVRDIKGTWNDYVMLYAARIQKKIDDQTEWEVNQRVTKESTLKAQKVLHPKASVHSWHIYPRNGDRIRGYKLEITFKTEDELKEFLGRFRPRR